MKDLTFREIKHTLSKVSQLVNYRFGFHTQAYQIPKPRLSASLICLLVSLSQKLN